MNEDMAIHDHLKVVKHYVPANFSFGYENMNKVAIEMLDAIKAWLISNPTIYPQEIHIALEVGDNDGYESTMII